MQAIFTVQVLSRIEIAAAGKKDFRHLVLPIWHGLAKYCSSTKYYALRVCLRNGDGDDNRNNFYRSYNYYETPDGILTVNLQKFTYYSIIAEGHRNSIVRPHS